MEKERGWTFETFTALLQVGGAENICKGTVGASLDYKDVVIVSILLTGEWDRWEMAELVTFW